LHQKWAPLVPTPEGLSVANGSSQMVS
jgi:hypothetical protein